MSTRHIALAATLLALVFLGHAASRFTQMGGAQATVAIAIYTLMALLLAPELSWSALFGISVANGLLLMLATSSPVPLGSFAAGALGFLVACAVTKLTAAGGNEIGSAGVLLNVVVTSIASVTFVAVGTWIGLSGTKFVGQNFARLGVDFGHGFIAWYLAAMLGIGLPSLIAALILTPILYQSVRPSLIRRGTIEARRARLA